VATAAWRRRNPLKPRLRLRTPIAAPARHPRKLGRDRAAALGLVGATLLWGATFVVIRDSLGPLDPAVLVWARFAAATAIFAVLIAPRARTVDRDAVIGGTVAGLLATGGYLFQAIGLTATTAGTSAFITSIGALFAGFFAWPLLGQRPSALLAAGIGLALLGSALMAWPSDLRPGAGAGWTLLGALCFALQIVAISRFAPRADPIALSGVQSLAVTLALWPAAAARWRELASLAGPGWWRLLYLIAAGSVLAPLLQVVAQRSLAPGRVGLLFALEPVFALGFTLTLGAERFPARWWWGAAIILGAVGMVERRPAMSAGASRPASG